MRLIDNIDEATKFLERSRITESYDSNPKIMERLGIIFGENLTVAQAVSRILGDIREQGDKALYDYAKRIDGFEQINLEVTSEERDNALDRIPVDVVESLEFASNRIREYQLLSLDNATKDFCHNGLGQKVTSLDKVGLYVPGGTAVYPSTVLMTAIPARVAGVNEIILSTPPGPNGRISTVVLAAAAIAQVDRIFKIGGAQAIGAMAYGTETVPAVDKIFGPGNVFVQTAKRMVFGTVGIDTIQGPTEAITIADGQANPSWCVVDLFAQAEHDPDSTSIIITDSLDLAQSVLSRIEEELQHAKRLEVLRDSLERNGSIIVVPSIEKAIDLSNLYAPEHLCLMTQSPESYLSLVKNAGALFLGRHSPHVLGDYVAGPSHALPTGGAAKFSSALGVNDFLKTTSLISFTEDQSLPLLDHGINIAMQEGFEAHARSLRARSGSISNGCDGD